MTSSSAGAAGAVGPFGTAEIREIDAPAGVSGARSAAVLGRAPKNADVPDAAGLWVGVGSGVCVGGVCVACPFSHHGVASSRRLRRGSCSAGEAGTSVMPLVPGLRRGNKVTEGRDTSFSEPF